MPQQEIGIKLKADTNDAIKSVKELEKVMHGLDDIKNHGNEESGFLSDKDVKRFQRLSKEAESTYRNFLSQYDRMKREFDKRKSDLESAMKNTTDKTTIDSLQRQVDSLKAQKQMIESQKTISQGFNNSNQKNINDINDMRTTSNPLARTLTNFGSRNIIGPIIGALSFGKMFGLARQGMGMIKSEESYGAQFGNRINANDYVKLRKDAMSTGLPNGYTAMQTMQTADAYSSLAGSKSVAQTFRNTNQIQQSARALGIDANSLAQSQGSMAQLGAIKDGEQRKFAGILAGAISKEGMAGRDKELVDAVTSVAQNSAQSQTSLSKGGLNQIVGLEAALGANIPGLRGQRGAQVLNSMDSGIKGGDNRIDMLLGWGTKYQGISGRAALDRRKSKGITDPENVKDIFTNLEKGTGGNKDTEQLYLEEIFGWSGEQASSILNNKKLMKTLKNGGLTKKQMEQLQKSGSTTLNSKQGNYDSSKAGKRARTDSQWEKTKKWGGEILDDIWQPVANGFTGMNPALQWGTMAAGGAGLSMFGGKLIKPALSFLGKLGSKRVGNLGETSRFNPLEWLKGLTGNSSNIGGSLERASKIAGKFAMPLAIAGSAVDIATSKNKAKSVSKNVGGLTGMWAGAEGGAVAGAALGTVVPGIGNVVGGAVGGLAGGIGGWFGGKQLGERAYDVLKPSKAEASQVESENLKQEKHNLEKKSSLVDKDQKLKNDEKKNIEDLAKITGSGSMSVPGQNSSGSGGGGGFWGNLLNGIKGFFGFGSSSGGSSGSVASKTSSNGNAGKIWNYFSDKGLSSGAISGIMGNLQQESGLDPNAPGGGLAQWTGSRKAALDKYAKKNNLSSNSMDAQLGFLYKELSSGNYGDISKLNGMSAGQAAEYFEKNYEKAGKPMMGNRVNYANGFYDKYGTGYNDNAASSGASSTLNVKVSGRVDGLTKDNNDLVTNSILKSIKANQTKVNLMYGYQQGVGGNR